MDKKIKDFSALIGSISFGIVSWGSAFVHVVQNNWFGAGDLIGFVFWVVIFSALTYPFLRFLHKKIKDKGILISYGSALLTSLALSITFILLLILVLGPWIGAFSFPVLFCLLIGSSISSVLTVFISQPKTWFPAFITSLILPVAFYSLVFITFSEPDQLLVTFSEDITYEQLSTFTGTEININAVKGFARVDADGTPRIRVWFHSGLTDEKRNKIKSKFDSLSYVTSITDIKIE